MLRQQEVNGAIFHSPTVERFTAVARLMAITDFGVQQRTIMLSMAFGGTAQPVS